MWPPDAEPEPDPESAHGPRSGRTVPGLRALLPARAFLCSLKGRLLLAESVSACAPRVREARYPRPSLGPCTSSPGEFGPPPPSLLRLLCSGARVRIRPEPCSSRILQSARPSKGTRSQGFGVLVPAGAAARLLCDLERLRPL
jgi:hypothetical protein